MKTRTNKQRGLAIVTFSLVAAVMVPFVGLAMDGAVLCVVKERLTSAVDSAATAAGHYLDKDHPDQDKMQSAARRFLDANFPQGLMGTGTRTVVVKGDRLEVTVDAPTYFLKLLHIRGVRVVAAHRIGRS